MKQILYIVLILLCFSSYAQNVGIGETNPANKLSVKGSMSIGSGYSTTAAPTNGAIIQGTVGIGTAAPSGLIDIKGSDWSAAGTTAVMIDNPAALYGPYLRFNGPSHVYDVISTGASTAVGAGYFLIWDNTVSAHRMVIGPNGHTGIGTYSPASILEVSTTVGGLDTPEMRISSQSAGWSPARMTFYSDRGSVYEWRPGYIQSGDNDPGYYAGRLDFYTNGFSYANRVNSVLGMTIYNGMVGIGTTNPTSALSVGASDQFQVNSTGNIISINSVATSFPSAQGAANTFIKNDGSGNLSWATLGSDLTAGTGISIIGNTISTNLAAGTGIAIAGNTISTSLTAGTGIGISGSTISTALIGGTGITISGSTINSYWTLNGSNDLMNNNSGNIYAGTTSMFFNASTGVVQHLMNTAGAGYGTIQNDGNGIWSLGYTGSYSTTLGTPMLSWTRGGDVGINTTVPTQVLDVKGLNQPPASSGTTSTAIVRIENTTGNGNVLDIGNENSSPYGTWMQCTDRTTLAATYPLIINPVGGKVGIGTSNPGYELTVNGQPGANGYTAFTNYSDSRLKKNIAPVSDCLDKIMLLRPVEFNYNEEYLNLYNDTAALSRLQKGFIAQEIKEVFPEMVGTVVVKDKEYYDLNLSHLQVYMVKAMQEQQKMIDEQNAQIDRLQKENSKMNLENNTFRSDIDKLKASVETLQQIIGSRAQK